MGFENKVAVITGAASGMGLLTSQCLAKEGTKVVMADVNEEAVQAKAAEIVAAGGEAMGITCDVRKYEQVVAVRDAAVERYGAIDYLVCFAGGAETRIFKQGGPFFEVPIEVYDWGIDVNLKGAFYFNHAVLAQMAKQKSGVIINLGSVSGMESSAGAVAYSASKAGIINGLTPSVAAAGAPYNVRCCCVSPGPVLTRDAMAGMTTLMNRAADPQEIVDLVLYLLSDKAAFITGSNFLIDGGRMLTSNKTGGLNQQYQDMKKEGKL